MIRQFYMIQEWIDSLSEQDTHYSCIGELAETIGG